MAVLKHEYATHGVRHLFDFKFCDASALGGEWRWIESPLPQNTDSFPPDCHYFALKTASGDGDAESCTNCYQVSGARVLKGLELVQELSWYGGAHKDRWSWSRNAKHWKDDFESDLNMVVTGPDCPSAGGSEAPRLIPTPARGPSW